MTLVIIGNLLKEYLKVVIVVFQNTFIQKHIKIIYFLSFKKLFLISSYQNNLKI